MNIVFQFVLFYFEIYCISKVKIIMLGFLKEEKKDIIFYEIQYSKIIFCEIQYITHVHAMNYVHIDNINVQNLYMFVYMKFIMK